MKKENKEGALAKVIANLVIGLGIFVGISYWGWGNWWALLLLGAVSLIWSICFSKVYTTVTKKKIKMDNMGCVTFIALIVCCLIAHFINPIAALVIGGLPIELCVLWIVWKIIVVILESLGILFTDAYDDDKK